MNNLDNLIKKDKYTFNYKIVIVVIIMFVALITLLIALSPNTYTKEYRVRRVEDGLEIVRVTSEYRRSTELIIPEKIRDIPVVSIGNKAFKNCSSLNSLIFEDDIKLKRIGSYAFSGCYNLESITIPDSVITIGNYAFNNIIFIFVSESNLTSITFGENSKLKSIGDSAFAYCSNLTSIKIPNSVTSIGDRAFSNCSSLTNITILNGLTNIGSEAFRNCSSLQSIIIPDSVISIGSGAFNDCNSLMSISILGNISNIGNKFFYNCISLVNFNIPNSVQRLGNYAFYGCSSLASITIPDSVTNIGDSAFYSCSNLTSITIPDSVKSIGEYSFGECDNLKSIKIEGIIPPRVGKKGFGSPSKIIIYVPSGRVSAYNNADNWNDYLGRIYSQSIIDDNGLAIVSGKFIQYLGSSTEITIPNNVTSIGSGAFRGCNILENIIVTVTNEKFKSINGVLFNKEGTTLIQYPVGNSRTIYIIPSTVQNIENEAFKNCSSLEIIILLRNSKLINIGQSAFSECKSLKFITIPSSLTSIGNKAFNNCTSLYRITIPDKVTVIGSSAFNECNSLINVLVKSETPPKIGWDVFYSTHSELKIYVPKESVDAYKTATKWSNYSTKIKAIED